MTTTIDLYFRQTSEAGGDDISRMVGTVDLDDLTGEGMRSARLFSVIDSWGGLLGDVNGYGVDGQITERGFEVVFTAVEPS